jgi:hypothetical protein
LGIGGYLASVILAECGDLRRFEGQFGSYIGLVPGMSITVEDQKVFRILRESLSQLRSYLVEAAWIAVEKIPKCKIIIEHQGKTSRVSL